MSHVFFGRLPLRQVGAVLSLDTELEPEDLYSGNRHWNLDGSCVLVAPDRVLTVRHSLEKSSRTAVFFPFEGLFPIGGEPEWEDQAFGDNLVVAALRDKEGRPVATGYTKPLPHQRIWSRYKHKGFVEVCGYGVWPETELPRARGLQQRHAVDLGERPPGSQRWDHYDNLDLCWSAAANGGKVLGNGNSGGPMIWRRTGQEPSVVGINRERKGDQQIGSWITDDRTAWLDELKEEWGTPFEITEPKATSYHPLIVEPGGGSLIRLRVPSGATTVQATLNATEGLRLQMKLAQGGSVARLLEEAALEKRAAGRFLCRRQSLDGAQDLAIAVAPVASAPVRTRRALAQLCVLFA